MEITQSKNSYIQTTIRIKETAAPIDNITKFAWNDDDYETVDVQHTCTLQQQLCQIKYALQQSDHVTAKAVEQMLQAQSLADLIGSIAAIRTQYQDILAKRALWRRQISALEDQIASNP